MTIDFCIVGGGIAGISVAAELSAHNRVVVLEREETPGYHTTGRSAALYSELFFDGAALGLSTLSRDTFLAPFPEFTSTPLYHDSGCIFTARDDDLVLLQSCLDKPGDYRQLTLEEMLDTVPVLKTDEGNIVAGMIEPDAFRLDVAALLDAYRKKLLGAGGILHCNAQVTALEKDPAGWQLTLANGETIRAKKIINAAGAWGDELAGLAGLRPVGLEPKRRTIIVFDGPEELDTSTWPAVGGLAGDYYFLPETGRLMGSSADEVPSPACDAQPEEYDIALAAHNIEAATTLEINQIRHRWAGLRTFAPDRQPVVGYDGEDKDFFWLVGQGGFGIQTAPAMARAAACLAIGEDLPDAFPACGVTEASLSPQRFSGNG